MESATAQTERAIGSARMGGLVAPFPPPLTVGLFGTDMDFLRILGSAIGKTGTESDLRFWNKKDRDVSVTALAAIPYPERVLPMLQVVALCDFPILVAGALDAAFGEMVLTLEASGRKGLLIVRDASLADRVRALVRDRLRGWVTMEWQGDESLRRFRAMLPSVLVPRDDRSACTVVLDHAFNVRGVGTVALGLVRRGTLRVHDELRLVPREASVPVRSIQRFDEEQTEAPPGSRVGVALRGVEADEIERGFLLTNDEAIRSQTEVRVRPFRRTEFAKDLLSAGVRGVHLAIGTYARPVVLQEVGDTLRVEADRPIPVVPGETAYLVAPRDPGSLRILGTGPAVA